MTAISVPSWSGVAASLLLVALAAAVAYRHKLHLTRELIIASLRAGLQLVAVGALLLVVFARAGLPGAFAWVTIMILIAGQVAGHRGTGLPRARVAATAGVATGSAITLGTLLALGVITTQARVVVPVGGMIVSGAMQAAGLTLRRLREDARTARPAIEARLCLGLSARAAFLPHQRSALRTALLPAIDSTKVVGLISLPGAMTGLILAGVDPLTAIRYQIVVMYMLLAATALAALATARLAEHALFDHAHRLLPLTPTTNPNRRIFVTPNLATTTLAAAAGSFGTGHIALTAAITGVLALAAAAWRLPRGDWLDMMAVGVLAGGSVFLWRISANMPQLNSDGLPGFSANDWLAPVLTYLFLTIYADLHPPTNPRHYAQTRALAVLISLAVNVITI